jgi:hypothetical protein
MRVPDPGPGTRNSLDAAGACVSSLLPSAQRRGRHCCRRVIPKGGSAAINVCYGLTYPAVRFVVKGNGAPATVHVRVNSRSLPGILSILDGGTFTAGTTVGSVAQALDVVQRTRCAARCKVDAAPVHGRERLSKHRRAVR